MFQVRFRAFRGFQQIDCSQELAQRVKIMRFNNVSHFPKVECAILESSYLCNITLCIIIYAFSRKTYIKKNLQMKVLSRGKLLKPKYISLHCYTQDKILLQTLQMKNGVLKFTTTLRHGLMQLKFMLRIKKVKKKGDS